MRAWHASLPGEAPVTPADPTTQAALRLRPVHVPRPASAAAEAGRR
jgi:hypothetical protein